MNQRRVGGGTGTPGGPAGNAGARGALLLAVAVILGIVLLQQFDSGIGSGSQVATGADTSVPDLDDDTTSTTRRVGLTTVPATSSTTAAARAKGDVRVLVANGSGIRGLAANTSTALRNLGWATLAPVDATSQVEKTAIQYSDGYEAEAKEIAANLSLPATVAARLAAPPVAAADLGDAKVIVVLGQDAPTAGTSSTAAGGAGSTTSTTRRP